MGFFLVDLLVLISNFFCEFEYFDIIAIHLRFFCYFCHVNKSKEIINESTSILMLAIYLFSSLSILSSHNHNEDHHHDNQDLILCENLDGNSFNNSDCSHESHLISSKESCAICDCFANCKPAVLDISKNTSLEFTTVKEIQLFTSLYLNYANNTRNKSPPFII